MSIFNDHCLMRCTTPEEKDAYHEMFHKKEKFYTDNIVELTELTEKINKLREEGKITRELYYDYMNHGNWENYLEFLRLKVWFFDSRSNPTYKL